MRFTAMIILSLALVAVVAMPTEARESGVQQAGTSSPLWLLFGLGCLGAIAPDLLRLYNLRTSPNLSPSFSSFYLGISACMALIGGTIALILPSVSPWGAFYAGISTPAIISTVLRQGGSLGAQGVHSSPASPAHARSAASRRRSRWRPSGESVGVGGVFYGGSQGWLEIVQLVVILVSLLFVLFTVVALFVLPLFPTLTLWWLLVVLIIIGVLIAMLYLARSRGDNIPRYLGNYFRAL